MFYLFLKSKQSMIQNSFRQQATANYVDRLNSAYAGTPHAAHVFKRSSSDWQGGNISFEHLSNKIGKKI